ncbi:MAG: hypothetical protein C4520_14840 [Candidatus Abyssobacteria bacterium SURF_5]|uniref:Uncharacterized protein n=1 Tax=Abyssobacteria bacterium (strain SURF_5) TaxID=2093360 RepID=A0A3A4NQP6_ABYX5|nr:MAG: hypothetical protein C4520_14840 [Candidatus Abyssubacteria bacterium SURF_5]
MGVRFPLDPGRPDLNEIQEAAAVKKNVPEQSSARKMPVDIRDQGVRRSAGQMLKKFEVLPAATAENESQAPSNVAGDTDHLIDIIG